MTASYRGKGWLWQWALVVLLVGGGLTWYLHQQPQTTQVRAGVVIAGALTGLIVGILIICATADKWLRR